MANKICESVSANAGGWSNGVTSSGTSGYLNDEESDDDKNRKFKVKKPGVRGKKALVLNLIRLESEAIDHLLFPNKM